MANRTRLFAGSRAVIRRWIAPRPCGCRRYRFIGFKFLRAISIKCEGRIAHLKSGFNLKKIAAMRWSNNSSLIIFVIAICAAMEIIRNLRISGFVTLDTQIVAAYFVFGLNLLAAIIGLWTRFRIVWLSYLVLSVASILFMSSTPLAAAWVLLKLATRHAFA
jgi:hypothetical protein